jgi:hypothetical protein
MKLYNLKRASDYDVVEWIEKRIRNLTPEQKQWIRDEEIIRFAPFYFFKKKTEKVKNVWLRLSIIFIIPIFFLLLIGLPFNFFITGNWGYAENMRWFGDWCRKCGL